MGSEDLFHKRKARSANKLVRTKEKRASYDRILIVCEGEKTEPHYLDELINYYKLNTANVEVDGNCASAPSKIVAYALKRYQQEKNKRDPFDKVYCVFDKDAHASYDAAQQTIAKSQPKNVFQAITSVPCFEYWLLLHYQYTDQPFHATGKKSSCDNLINELKIFLPNYKKADKGIYAQLMHETSQAIAYSKRAAQQAKRTTMDNPSTMMHVLVEYLQNLAS
jgi:hypothetical protein